ncbi:MAG: recombination-associated protein RdgC [Desulfarculus sp.]|nr:recombination-associated protein RdgC [Desulfarculus sp.]
MGLFKGAVSLSRYQVACEVKGFWDFVDRRVRANLFVDIDDSTEEISVGWCSAHDALDTEKTWLAYAGYRLEPHLVLGMRVDRRRVPGALLRKLHRQEVAKARALREGRPLSRTEREDLKEKARLDLLLRTVPSTVLVEVVWDTKRGELWVATASRGLLDYFEDLFRRTFDAVPVPRIPWLLAGELAGPARRQALEGLRPADLYQEVA